MRETVSDSLLDFCPSDLIRETVSESAPRQDVLMIQILMIHILSLTSE